MNVTRGRRGEIMDGKLKTSLCPTDSRVKVQTVIGANRELTKVQQKIKKSIKETYTSKEQRMDVLEGKEKVSGGRASSLFMYMHVSISYLTFQLQFIC